MLKLRTSGLVAIFLVLVRLGGFAAAQPRADQPTPIPGITDKLGLDAAPQKLLDPPFENLVAGVTFRPPAGCKLVKKTDNEGNTVGEFTNEQRQWLLKVTRASTARPMPLQTTKDKGIERLGLLDYTVNDIKKEHPAAEILRQEIINVGEYPVGVAIVRLNLGTQRFLRQQAIFQADERLYYVFNFTTPASKSGAAGEDPAERLAAETFKEMLETIQLLDRSWIRKDQVERLFRTRALFVGWSDKGGKKIKDAIVPEQWLRLTKDGKDIGYSYVVEEFLEGRDVKNNPSRAFDGVLISVRTRTHEGATQVDVGSQSFVSLDRKHEDWASVINIITNKGQKNEDKAQTSEYGFSELRLTRKVDPGAARDERDAKNAPVREIETYRLSVVNPGKKDTLSKPQYFTPSPWYIPQAIGVMLPRLLPLQKPVTYLFQIYVSDQKEVVHRYVDVGFEKEVQLGGRTVKAIPITDRIRMESSPTTHYMSPDGKYLGSVNEETKMAILPADAETLKKIWPNSDLKRPENLDRPVEASTGK